VLLSVKSLLSTTGHSAQVNGYAFLLWSLFSIGVVSSVYSVTVRW
jgi:hypothetical protein